MASRTCMNIFCGKTSSAEWKRGWILGSGTIASLCSSCGSAYEQQVFCKKFHADETGWRGCVNCGKLLHCGCIASLSLIELLDTGGVKCISCAKATVDSSSSEQKLNESGTVTLNNIQISHLNSCRDIIGGKQQFVTRNVETDVVIGQLKKEDALHSPGAVGSRKTLLTISSPMAAEDFGAFISLGGPTRNPHRSFGVAVEEREQGNTSSGFQQGTPSCHLFPKPSKSPLSASINTNISMAPQMRIRRPPVEGRGRSQMLPRYWPRITEQELQQISGDPNCTVVPLFEKVLSASDAGRIGRLVLPKACAEAYFPPISQPEGLPLKIKDIKGKEWVFQFRFWPNNNSRMYVLEGVTPCIQSMQLQAGDTVTFSRMDPEGKLVMGFRKASAALQTLKGSADPHINGVPKQINSAARKIMWNNVEKHRAGEGVVLSSMVLPEKKRCRNIGSKSKRLHIDSQDVLELKLTWEDVQDMLRAPENARPTVVMIEDYEIEEYEAPPVLGKWSIFAVRSSGILEQWTQCDNCSKWRGLPAEVLLPPNWTCGENAWDKSRCSCSAPDDLIPRDIENFLLLSKDCKKRKVSVYDRTAPEQDPCGIETLANAATIHGDNPSDSAPGASSSGAITTKHPRHKPGCSCIVCIQPPSGKGKHKPMCDCNVCSTVKRRFQTLMMRKKQRQSEQEAEIANGRDQHNKIHHSRLQKDEPEVGSSSTYHTGSCFDHHPTVESEGAPTLASDPQTTNSQSPNEAGKLDLNFDPENMSEVHTGLPHASMTSLLQMASLPLESYMKQNGLTNLAMEQQVSSGLSGPLQVTGEAGVLQCENQITDCTVKEQVDVGDQSCLPDKNLHGTQ